MLYGALNVETQTKITSGHSPQRLGGLLEQSAHKHRIILHKVIAEQQQTLIVELLIMKVICFSILNGPCGGQVFVTLENSMWILGILTRGTQETVR